MSKFTPTVAFTTEFDGDIVSMRLRRFKKREVMTLSPYFMANDDGNLTMSFENHTKFEEVVSSLLPKNVMDFSGLVDENGVPISFKDMLDEAYFTELATAILKEMFLISRPSDGETKNLGQPPAESLPE